MAFCRPVGQAAEPDASVRMVLRPMAARAMRRKLVAARLARLLTDRRAARLAELPPAPEPPVVEGASANPLDRFIVAGWASLPADERPDGLCDDATFARRVYLDLIGVIPTLAELNHFLGRFIGRQAGQTDRSLLARKADYAAHWTVFGKTRWPARSVLAQGGIPTRGNYRQWLLDSFAREQALRRDGGRADRSDDARPPGGRESGFVRHEVSDRVRAQRGPHRHAANGGHVGQVFLSASMKCASCHDHFENRRVDAGAVPGFCRPVRPARPGKHPLRRPQRPIRRRPAFRSTCRAPARGPAASTTGCTWRRS